MPEECHHPDSPLTSGAADAPMPTNWRAVELLGVRISLTARLNHIIPIKGHSTAIRDRYSSVSAGTRLQDGYLNFGLDSSLRQNFSLLYSAHTASGAKPLSYQTDKV
jgi:hypothetical protein